MDKKLFPMPPTVIKNLYDEYAAHDCFYWYPLNSLKKEVPAVAYDLRPIFFARGLRDWRFRGRRGIRQIRECLRQAGISHCNAYRAQVGETNIRLVHLPHCLIERDRYGYHFPWADETYYFDGDDSDWLIYVSHKRTITFVGERLASLARAVMDPTLRIDKHAQASL